MSETANSQVIDTISQVALMTVGAAGPAAQGLMAQAFEAAIGTAAQAAVAQQEATQVLADAALAAALKRISQAADGGRGDGRTG